MDDRQREQVRLITAHQVSLANREVDARVRAIFAEHAAKGRLHSGATIKIVVRAVGEITAKLLATVVPQVHDVSATLEAYEAVTSAIGECLDASLAKLPNVIFVASGESFQPGNESVRNAAMALFNEMRADIESDLAIKAFEFTQTGPAAVRGLPDTARNKGGTPGHEFWDDMWAAIAFALYDGDLMPKSQADVERAMTNWIEDRGKSAAVSTVRKRARLLWDRIARAEA